MCKVEFDRDANEFTVVDKLNCSRPAVIEMPFHLHPSVNVELQGSTAILEVAGNAKVQMMLDENLSYSIREDGWYSEHFGVKVPTKFLYAKTNCKGNAVFVTKLHIL